MKNQNIYNLLLIMICSTFIMGSCEEELVGREQLNTPVNNFEYFWKTFDTHYGLFDVKKVDWDKVHQQYRPQVTDNTTDEELYKVFGEMILLLRDNHINLYPTNGTLPVYPGGLVRYSHCAVIIKKVQEDYDIEVVKKYVTDLKSVSGNIKYGMLPDGLGYINITGTDSQKEVRHALDEAIENLQGTKGLIVDIRGCYGGDDATMQYIAGRFSASDKLYMITRKRNGPKHTDFTNPVEWFVKPTGKKQYTNPVILLTSNFSQSTAETFALAMNELDHVKLVGDTTAGSYSDNPTFELPNGWMFSFSIGDFRAADGKSYEGIGTAPDVWICNTKEDLLAGKDRTLEKAIEILK